MEIFEIVTSLELSPPPPHPSRHLLFLLSLPVKMKGNLIQQYVTIQALKISLRNQILNTLKAHVKIAQCLLTINSQRLICTVIKLKKLSRVQVHYLSLPYLICS